MYDFYYYNKNNKANLPKKSALSGNNGFTMAELMLVVGIILVLSAVGFVSAMTMLRNSRQAASDKAAESIYSALAANLQEVYAFQNERWESSQPYQRSSDGKKVKDSDGKPLIEEGARAKTDKAYLTFLAEDNGSATSGATNALDLIYNKGSVLDDVDGAISRELYNKSIVVEYNPSSAQIHSVFYGSGGNASNSANYYTDGNDAYRGDNTARKREFKGYLGYYEAPEQGLPEGTGRMVIKVDNTAPGKSGQLYNYDELKTDLYCKLPEEIMKGSQSGSNEYAIKAKISVYGLTSKAQVDFTREAGINAWLSSDNTVNETTFRVPLTFDSLKSRQENDVRGEQNHRFVKQFCSDSYTPGSIFDKQFGTDGNPEKLNDKKFYPGENIRVKAVVGVYTAVNGKASGSAIMTATDDAVDNSLFYYGSKKARTGVISSEYKAYIKYARHLQNLEEASGIGNDDIASSGISGIDAVQIADIDFDRFGDTVKDKNNKQTDDETKRLWRDLEDNSDLSYSKYFTPIVNQKLNSYIGKGADPAASDDDSETTGSLFDPFVVNAAPKEEQYHIRNIRIDLSKAKSISRSGSENESDSAGLFGVFAGKDIKNVILESPNVVGATASSGGSGSSSGTGGLVGYANGSGGTVNIEGCQLYMRPSYEKEEKNGSENHSKGSSRDVESGKYAADYKEQWMVGSGNVGGLVGMSASGLDIKESFAATVVNSRAAEGDAAAGGLVGRTNGALKAEKSYADCYIAAGNPSSNSDGIIGGLAGYCPNDSTFENCYSAGFVLGDVKTAAGFAPCEVSSVKNSYTVFNFDDISEVENDARLTNADDINTINGKGDPEQSGMIKNYPETKNHVDKAYAVVQAVSDASQVTTGGAYYLNSGAGPDSGSGIEAIASLPALIEKLSMGDSFVLSPVDNDESQNRATIAYNLGLFFDSKLERYPFPLIKRSQLSDGESEYLPHKNDWLAKHGQNYDIEIENTEKLAFRIVTSSAPSASDIWSVRIKGVSSKAERTLKVTTKKNESGTAYIIEDSSESLDDVRSADYFGGQTAANASGAAFKHITSDRYVSAWIVLDKMKNIVSDADGSGSWTFNKQYGNGISGASQGEAIGFIPGEDIIISWGPTPYNYGAGADFDSGALAALNETDVLVNSLFSGIRTAKKDETSGWISQNDIQVRSGIGSSSAGFEAKLCYGRHLQNLDRTVSDFDPSRITKNVDCNAKTASTISALQQNDIFFDCEDALKNESGEHSNRIAHKADIDAIWVRDNEGDATDEKELAIVEDYDMQWHKVYKGRPFISITNDKIISYEGKAENSSDSSKNSLTQIVGMTVDMTGNLNGFGLNSHDVSDIKAVVSAKSGDEKNAGLFAVFSGNKLSNIAIVSARFTSGNNSDAGGFAGLIKSAASGHAELKNCCLYMRPVYDDDVTDGASGTHQKDDPRDVEENRYADDYRQKWLSGDNNAGGLVGRTENDIDITDCFAATVINANSSSGHAGGLVGNASGKTLTIKTSYSDSYIHAGEHIGGLVGACGNNSTFADCYSAGFVLGTKGDGVAKKIKAGAFVPDNSFGTDAEITHSYSIFYYSDITMAKYDDGEADYGSNGDKPFSVDTPITNGLTAPDDDEIGRLLDRSDGIGKTNSIHKAYYLAEFFKDEKADGYDRLEKFARWKDANQKFGKAYPKAGLPHHGDWMASNASLDVINGAMLYARIKVPLSYDAGAITLKVTVKDDDKNEHSVTLPVRDGSTTDLGDLAYNAHRVKKQNKDMATYFVVLDDITTKRMRFADIFKSSNFTGDEVEEAKYFYPGVTITKVEVTVGNVTMQAKDATKYPAENSASGDKYDEFDGAEGQEPVWNSIFANYSLYNGKDWTGNNVVDNKDDDRVLIANARHLENLDKRISRRRDDSAEPYYNGTGNDHILKIKEAKQISDVFWSEESDNQPDTENLDDDELPDAFVQAVNKLKKKWDKASDNNSSETDDSGISDMSGVRIFSGAPIGKNGDAGDVKAYNNDPSAQSYQPVNMYVGEGDFVYNGNGKRIVNLNIKAPQIENLSSFDAISESASGMISNIERSRDEVPIDTGMFGFVDVNQAAGRSFTVKDLELNNSDVEDGANSGALIGRVNQLTDTDGSGRNNMTMGTVHIENVLSTGSTYVYGKMLNSGSSLYARGYAGGLLGVANEANVEMERCGIHGKYSFVHTSADESIIKQGTGSSTTVGGGAVGGMIGNFQWCHSNIQYCYASVYVYGEFSDTAGGFIGRTYGNDKYNGKGSIIKHCYVGGHTENGSYQSGAYDRDHPDVTASNVSGYKNSAGFIGYSMVNGVSGLEIEDCFTDASVYSSMPYSDSISSKTEPHTGGFIAHYQADNSNFSIKDCYVAGRIYTERTTRDVGLFAGYVTNNNEATLSGNVILGGINESISIWVGNVGTQTRDNNAYYANDADTNYRIQLAYNGENATESQRYAYNRLYSGGKTAAEVYDNALNGRDYPFHMPQSPSSGSLYSNVSTYGYDIFNRYHGDWEEPGAEQKYTDAPAKLVNKDKLTLEFDIPFSEISDHYWMSILIKGEKSGKIYVAPLAVRREAHGGDVIASGHFEDTRQVLGFGVDDTDTFGMDELDSFVRTKRNGNTVTVSFALDDITVKGGHFTQLFPKLLAGENITVYVKQGKIGSVDDLLSGLDSDGIKSGQDEITMTATTEKAVAGKVNSLFGNDTVATSNLKPNDDNIAEIRYGRHLQNLDPVVSGLNGVGHDLAGNGNALVFSKAEQTRDLDWLEFVEYNKDEGNEPVIYGASTKGNFSAALTEKGEYYGIYNRRLNSYSGKETINGEEKQFEIKNITIAGQSEIKADNFAGEGDINGSNNKSYWDKGHHAGLFRYVDWNHFEVSNLFLKGFHVQGFSSGNNRFTGAVIGGTDAKLGVEHQIIIRSVTIEDSEVIAKGGDGNNHAGGIIGSLEYARDSGLSDITVKNLHVVTEKGDVGGLIGCVKNGTTKVLVDGIKAEGLSVEGGYNVGGFIGYASVSNQIDIKDADIEGMDITSVNKDKHAGGLIGFFEGNSDSSAISIGGYGNEGIKIVDLKVVSQNAAYAGGVIGKLMRSVLTAKNVHVYGKDSFVYSNSAAGGLFGYIENNVVVDIDSCSASVYVTSETTHAGGFIAEIRGTGNITKCYAGGHTSVNGEGKAVYLQKQALARDGDSITVASRGGYNVFGGSNNETCAGGFVGKNLGEVTYDHCFSTASVCLKGPTGNNQTKTAGFCGGNYNGSEKGIIKNCYSAGKVFKPQNYKENYSIVCFFSGDKCNNESNENYYLSSVYDMSDPFYNTTVKEYENKRGKANSKSDTGLKEIDTQQRAESTIRFDGLVITDGENGYVLEYPYPFYVTDGADKTYYGDWSTDGQMNVITLSISYTINEEQKTAKVYYFRGMFYGNPVEAEEAKTMILEAEAAALEG